MNGILDNNSLTTTYALPHLRKSKDGCIVNISSIAANAAARNSCTYCATKGGIKSLTKALAIDEAKNGVRVNSIAPGGVETELSKSLVPEETRTSLGKCHTTGRLAQPREIGQACSFLAVDETFTTGEELFCTGGSEIGYGVKDPDAMF